MFQIQTQVIKTSEYCSENTILFVGSYNLISAVSYFSIALITVFVVIIVILIRRRRAKGKQEDGDEMKEPGEDNEKSTPDYYADAPLDISLLIPLGLEK